MPQGVGGLVYLSDESENVSRISTAGRAYFSDSYTRIKNHSAINVSSASGGSQLESCEIGRAYLRSESGNNIMWWGGTGEDAPYSGRGFPIYGGEVSIPIHVTNFSAIRVVASTSGQIIYPIGYLNGEDITLPNTLPTYPDTTAPFVVETSPVSGFSGVALNTDITATFSEPINESSLVSGVFALSPAHNVSFFVDSGDNKKIVLSPNTNLSGVTVYNAVISTGITDLGGNRLSGQYTWPFTTVSGAPPPDTTPPVISGVTPVSGATAVATTVSPVVIFSEKMLSGTINTTNIYLATTSGAGVGNITATVSLDAVDQKTVTVDPNADLAGGTITYLNVTTGVQDLAGNAMASAKSNHPFTTVYNFTEVYNVSTTADNNKIGDGNDEAMGLRMTSNASALLNQTPKRVTMKLYRGSTSTNDIASLVIRNASNTLLTTFGTFNANVLTETAQDITITNLNNTTTMQDNYSLLLEYDGPGNLFTYRTTSSAYTGAAYYERKVDGSYDEDSAKDIGWKIDK